MAANKPATKTNSQASSGSTASQDSTGIGAGIAPPTPNPDLPPNLTPEGFGLDSSIKVYDAIVYIIYCPEHDKIAVTNVERARCVWLPFVFLPDGVTWKKASQDGVAQIISHRDKEMDAAAAAKKAPTYDMEYMNVLRIQLPTEKFVTRLANLVILRKVADSEFKCCQRSPRINWLRASDILADHIDKTWGPELKNFTKLVGEMNKTAHEAVISEFTLQNSFHYLHLEESPEQALLVSSQVKTEHVLEIYEDFVEHCYPAFSMCFESFKHYLIKYGFDKKDPRLPYLFSAASLYGNDYLDFHEMLLFLVIMEPNTKHLLEARLKFIFRYYDSSRAGSLNLDEFTVMVQDIAKAANPKEELTNEQLVAKLEEAIKCVGMSASQEFPEINFIKAVHTGRFKDTEKLCRSPKSILAQISKLIHDKVEKSKTVNEGFLANRRKTKGICYRCQAPNYQYCLHCVTLDTSGRCVEPRIINDQWIEPCATDGMNEHKYSIEYVFGNSSMPNIIVDLVKDFYHKSRAPAPDGGNKPPVGLMASREDWTVFTKYLNMLCEALKGLLQNEDKLIKINAPALVLGDLQGNLHDLFVVEKHFWHSFPAIPNNFVFLGNYSGLIANGVECLAYLFSLKLIAPNKFFLLRGANEMRSQNKKSLLNECNTKYGTNFGRRIYDMLNEVFERLPFAVIIDETILCVHSGIPKSLKISKLNQLKKDIISVYREAPVGYEVLVNQPLGIDEALKNCNSSFKDAIQNKSNGGNKAAENSNSAKGGSTKKQKSAISTAIDVTGFAASDHFLNAFTFDETAFQNFVRANGFSHLIRSQSYIPSEGFDLRFGNRCITVFSCSNYLQQYATLVGGKSEAESKKEPANPCTAAFVDGGNSRIRMMAFDTAGQLAPTAPATKERDEA